LPTNINSTKATVPSGNATDKLHNYSLSPIWISALQKARTVAEDPEKAKSDVCKAANISSLTTEMSAAVTKVDGDSTITTGMDAFNALCGYQFYEPDKPGFDRTFNFDADGDGTVDVNDVTTTINYILKKPYTNFIMEAADVDGDKTIDVNDVQGIIDIALGKAKAAARKMEEE
jgi:Ca2+-binding EF-hand superfamily protein